MLIRFQLKWRIGFIEELRDV